MGMYLNPGNEVFRRMVSADIFVDKSMLLAETNMMLNSTESYICMSRPRRFGKTYAGNMLSAYYSKGCDSRELFKDLKITSDADYEKHLNQYNVIRLDIAGLISDLKKRSSRRLGYYVLYSGCTEGRSGRGGS